MKQLVLLFALTISSISFAQTHVSKTDYQKMDNQEKRISDYVDSALAGLKALKQNAPASYANYQATLSISANEKDKLGNIIAIGIADGTTPVSNAQSCVICNLGSGLQCYKRIRAQLANGQVVIVTIALNSEGCGVLTWN